MAFLCSIYTIFILYLYIYMEKSAAGSCNTMIIKLEGKLFHFKAPFANFPSVSVPLAGGYIAYCVKCCLFLLWVYCLDCQCIITPSTVKEMFLYVQSLMLSSCLFTWKLCAALPVEVFPTYKSSLLYLTQRASIILVVVETGLLPNDLIFLWL